MITHVAHNIPDREFRVGFDPKREMIDLIELAVQVGEIFVHLGRVGVMPEETPDTGVALPDSEERNRAVCVPKTEIGVLSGENPISRAKATTSLE